MADAGRRTRAASLSSVVSFVVSDRAASSKRPAVLSPSPTRASAGRALEEAPNRRRPGRRSKPVRMFQAMCRSLPVITPRCGREEPGAAGAPTTARLTSSDSLLSQIMPSSATGLGTTSRRRMTGTLFGYRDGRIALSLQENPRCQPALVVELALPTHALLRELSTTAGARIVLETEKRAAEGDVDGGSGSGSGGGQGASASGRRDDGGWLLEEPVWSMFCNGKKVGFAVRRDIAVLETLWAVSMGGGVLPALRSNADGTDGEMAYMRGCFEHAIGSPDSESLYMMGPHGGAARSSPSSSLGYDHVCLGQYSIYTTRVDGF